MPLSLPSPLQEIVSRREWQKLDKVLSQLCSRDGELFKKLKCYHHFDSIEHIIAIRSAPKDEDGIWHDDGSRYMAFSLSLNINPLHICGGNLLLRKKGCPEVTTIAPPKFGTLLIFLTGQYGFEHKVEQVTEGERIVAAGWCS